MANLAKVFGARMRMLRTARGFSQAGLAERSGMSEEWIRRMERGEASPSFRTIETLAGSLGVDPHELFDPREDLSADERVQAAIEGLSEDQLQWLINGARLLRVTNRAGSA